MTSPLPLSSWSSLGSGTFGSVRVAWMGCVDSEATPSDSTTELDSESMSTTSTRSSGQLMTSGSENSAGSELGTVAVKQIRTYPSPVESSRGSFSSVTTSSTRSWLNTAFRPCLNMESPQTTQSQLAAPSTAGTTARPTTSPTESIIGDVHSPFLQLQECILPPCMWSSARRTILSTHGLSNSLLTREDPTAYDIALRLELQLLEHMRLHPHPNIVQCWGFYFHPILPVDGSTETPRLTDLLAVEPLRPLEEAFEAARTVVNVGTEDNRSDEEIISSPRFLLSRISTGASQVDVALSLCSGGSLADYTMDQMRDKQLELLPPPPHIRTPLPNAASSVPYSVCCQGDPKEGCYPILTDAWHKAVETFYREKDSDEHLTRTLQGTDSAPTGEEQPDLQDDLAYYGRAISDPAWVAILYAALHSLRHTHGVLHLLHRDVKPENILLCLGSALEMEQDAAGHRVRSESDRSGRPSSLEEELTLLACPPGIDPQDPPGDFADLSQEFPAVVVPMSDHLLSLSLPCWCCPPNRPQSYRGARQIQVLPQEQGWRVQLADFGLSTQPGTLQSSEPCCGTLFYMAPEVRYCGISLSNLPELLRGLFAETHSPKEGSNDGPADCMHGKKDNCPPFTSYGPPADVYSLGISLQALLVSSLVCTLPSHADWWKSKGNKDAEESEEDAPSADELLCEEDELDATPRQGGTAATDPSAEELEAAAQRCERQQERFRNLTSMACGALWVDEDSMQVGDSVHYRGRRVMVVPRRWRCDLEIRDGLRIRLPVPEEPAVEDPVDAADLGDHEDVPMSETLQSPIEGRDVFVVPRTWRCRDELHEGRLIRLNPNLHAADDGDDDVHEDTSSTTTTAAPVLRRETRPQRCRSCSKMHRSLIELANAMTHPVPSSRPTVEECLTSPSVLSYGTFSPMAAGQPSEEVGTVRCLWRPPSLSSLKPE